MTAGGRETHVPLDAVILNLTGKPRGRPVVSGLPGYRQTVVTVDWPDMSPAPFDSPDWHFLAKRLKSLNRPLHVHCQQGHGRTGTTLAILLTLWKVIPAGDPVEWLRQHYCPRAVETLDQIRQIESVTGRVVAVGPIPFAPLTADLKPSHFNFKDSYRLDEWGPR